MHLRGLNPLDFGADLISVDVGKLGAAKAS